VPFTRILLLLTSTMALFGAVGNDTFHWSGKVPAGQLIEVRGINGSIHAQPALGNDVDVIAYKNGERYDTSGIEVRVVEYEGGVTICAVYPSASGVDECVPGAGGRPNALRNDVSVDFTVRVPKGVRFLARTVNGLVEATSLDADTEAHTVNGNVKLSTAGAGQGETVNGSIFASVGKFTSPLSFSTVNGGITLEMPRDTAAKVHADTVNGAIQTDFRLPVSGQFPGKHIAGTIGHGGPDLHIATVNGAIHLRRSTRRNF
jgi:hypothetical protein